MPYNADPTLEQQISTLMDMFAEVRESLPKALRVDGALLGFFGAIEMYIPLMQIRNQLLEIGQLAKICAAWIQGLRVCLGAASGPACIAGKISFTKVSTSLSAGISRESSSWQALREKISSWTITLAVPGLAAAELATFHEAGGKRLHLPASIEVVEPVALLQSRCEGAQHWRTTAFQAFCKVTAVKLQRLADLELPTDSKPADPSSQFSNSEKSIETSRDGASLSQASLSIAASTAWSDKHNYLCLLADFPVTWAAMGMDPGRRMRAIQLFKEHMQQNIGVTEEESRSREESLDQEILDHAGLTSNEREAWERCRTLAAEQASSESSKEPSKPSVSRSSPRPSRLPVATSKPRAFVTDRSTSETSDEKDSSTTQTDMSINQPGVSTSVGSRPSTSQVSEISSPRLSRPSRASDQLSTSERRWRK